MMVAHAVIGIIMDVVLMVLPIWMIWKNMIFTKKAIQVVLIFSVGIFVILTGIIRLWYIKTLVFAIDPYVSSPCSILQNVRTNKTSTEHTRWPPLVYGPI
jgi:hypothetical protein